jgi:hypothetical protein
VVRREASELGKRLTVAVMAYQKTGDERIKKILIEQIHEGMAGFIHKQFGPIAMIYGYSYLEDFQNYCLPYLLKAADKYDPESGRLFSTYAIHWLKAAQNAFIYSTSSVKISRNIKVVLEIPITKLILEDKEDEAKQKNYNKIQAIQRGIESEKDIGYEKVDIFETIPAEPEQKYEIDFLKPFFTPGTKENSRMKQRDWDIIKKCLDHDRDCGAPGGEFFTNAKSYGLCKERIRQIKLRFIAILRKHLEKDTSIMKGR